MICLGDYENGEEIRRRTAMLLIADPFLSLFCPACHDPKCSGIIPSAETCSDLLGCSLSCLPFFVLLYCISSTVPVDPKKTLG